MKKKAFMCKNKKNRFNFFSSKSQYYKKNLIYHVDKQLMCLKLIFRKFLE